MGFIFLIDYLMFVISQPGYPLSNKGILELMTVLPLVFSFIDEATVSQSEFLRVASAFSTFFRMCRILRVALYVQHHKPFQSDLSNQLVEMVASLLACCLFRSASSPHRE